MPETRKRQRRRPYLFLVKRGPQPSHHRVPFHPVIVTDVAALAKWEADWTGERAWVWQAHRGAEPYAIHGGWLLSKWDGLDIDYGHIVRHCVLPDGTHTGFHHPTSNPETWSLLNGAVWYSDRELPASLAARGVVESTDDFTVQQISEWFWREATEREWRKRA